MKKKAIVTMVLAVTVISITACGKDQKTVTTMSGTELEELDTTEKDNSELDVVETENMDTEVAPTESEAPEESQESTQTQQKPNTSTQTTGDSTSQKPNNTTQTTGNSTPAHTHVWKEHTATKQEWVPNIVTVPDYATQQVKTGSKIVCNCGAELTMSEAEDHGIAHVLAGEPSNYSIVPVYEEQTVQIGSHEEDQGHYETVSYVDYYYCDCGATK